MTRAKIRVTLKPTVLDAQGAVVEQALRALGYDGVRQVRMGRYIELDLAGEGSPDQQVREMCDRLLANPIIESYSFELQPIEGSGTEDTEKVALRGTETIRSLKS
jgi:phosphoribosylformylglycinamidine synthase